MDRGESKLIKERSESFFIASLFFSSKIRKDIHSLYGFLRTVDDLADDPHVEPLVRVKNIEDFEVDSLCTINYFQNKYNIPPHVFEQFLQTQKKDAFFSDSLCKVEPCAEDTYFFADGVAGTVGEMIARMLGSSDPLVIKDARKLGIAMQYTNILRDVLDDFANLGRVYVIDYKFLGDEAEKLFVESKASIRMLPSGRLPVRLARRFYWAILRELALRDYAPGPRIRISKWKKLKLLLSELVSEVLG